MSVKQRLPFLRTSVWRLGVAMPNFMKTGQIGDLVRESEYRALTVRR